MTSPLRLRAAMFTVLSLIWLIYAAPPAKADPAGWHAWESLGGGLGSDPAVSSWGPNRLDVFVAGTDDGLWHKSYDGGNGWSGWESLGGVLDSAPGVVSWGPGRIDVFVVGTDGGLWHKWYDGGHGWSGWEGLGGVLTSAPTISSWGPGRLDIFGTGTDGAVWHKWYDGGNGWSGWESLGGDNRDFAAPAAVSWAQSRIDVFTVGFDINGQGTPHARRFRGWWMDSGWLGLSWASCPARLASAPAATTWGGTVGGPNSAPYVRLDLFALDMEGRLGHSFYQGDGWRFDKWSCWEQLGSAEPTELVSAPAAVAWANNRLDVFVASCNFFDVNDECIDVPHLVHKWYQG